MSGFLLAGRLEEPMAWSLLPEVLSQRRSQSRSLEKSGADCRPSICKMVVKLRWEVLADRIYVKAPALESPKKKSMLCSLTEPSDATAQIHMKRKVSEFWYQRSLRMVEHVKIGEHT